MLFSFIYLVFASLLKLLVGSRRPAQVKDVELIVLRHQLKLLRRLTALFSPRQAAYSRASAAMVCSSRRRPGSAGTASSCGDGGHTRV